MAKRPAAGGLVVALAGAVGCGLVVLLLGGWGGSWAAADLVRVIAGPEQKPQPHGVPNPFAIFLLVPMCCGPVAGAVLGALGGILFGGGATCLLPGVRAAVSEYLTRGPALRR